jgi:hypothetical protein
MRQIMLLAALTLTTLVTTANAQDTSTLPGAGAAQLPADQQAPQPTEGPQSQQVPGPISGGVYHQPTAAEIEQRERDTKAAQLRAQRENREVDQLYNQLIHPNPPCTAAQGCAGSSP